MKVAILLAIIIFSLLCFVFAYMPLPITLFFSHSQASGICGYSKQVHYCVSFLEIQNLFQKEVGKNDKAD
jgi:hypothetical protein